MKLFRIGLAMLPALACCLTSCSPDHVGPAGKNTPISLTPQMDTVIHGIPGDICGPTVSLALALPNGDKVVDYCGSLNGVPIECTTPQPDWGVSLTANLRSVDEEDHLLLDIMPAQNWFIANCVSRMGDPSDFALGSDGVPIINASWQEEAVNPLQNQWSLSWNLGEHTGPQCVAFAARVTMAKINFFSPEPDPLSIRQVWVYNEDFDNPEEPERNSPSVFITPWCLNPCPGDEVEVDPRVFCEEFPAIPAPACTQTAGSGGVYINHPADVVCVPGNRNIGNVNFNGAGTLLIAEGATISGGINANNGGALIVKGHFNWNGNANINGNFRIYVLEGGTLTRGADLTMNNQNNVLVNLGTLDIGHNLTYNGAVYNSGTIHANGINVNSSNSKLINCADITSNNFVNINNSTLMENCGSLRVGNNLEMNGGSTVKNFCSIVVDNVTHANGSFEHHGTLVSGPSGTADGFSIQGATVLHDNSVILTRNFFWSANQPLQLDGNATVLVANAGLGASGQVTSLNGTGRLRMSGGSSLTGEGSLLIADIDPVSTGDNPTSPNVSFPEGLHNLVNKGGGVNLVIRALNPATDLPALCE